MIEYVKGNLLEAKVEALVNTVNCVGIMGKGLALQFKKSFPINFQIYEKACNAKEVVPGKMLVVQLSEPKYIINFPTKRHWRDNSRIEDIKEGLQDLVKIIKAKEIKSIAIPPLGCGLGKLNWNLVKSLIQEACVELTNVKILIFEPV